MNRSIKVAIYLLAIALIYTEVPSQAWAQDPVLSRLYGSGVHAYFGGDYVRAHELLTRAIKLGMEDPRVYYYRGLAYLKLGRPEEAEEDFRKGAEIEAKDFGIFYEVGRALERVQGRPRLLIEKHRFAARTAAKERAEQLRRERYGLQRAQEQNLLLEQGAPASGTFVRPSPGVGLVPQGPSPKEGLISPIPPARESQPGASEPPVGRLQEDRGEEPGQAAAKPPEQQEESESVGGVESAMPTEDQPEEPAVPSAPFGQPAPPQGGLAREMVPRDQMEKEEEEEGLPPLPPPPVTEE
jgi:hypothetical protein